jgi:hypothetical protein
LGGYEKMLQTPTGYQTRYITLLTNGGRVPHFFLKNLKNIENRVAWFLAELCKAKKGVQKYNDGNRGKMQIFFCGGYCEQDDHKWENKT